MRTTLLTLAGLVTLALAGAQPAPTASATTPARYDRVERQAFNRAAVRLNLPLYWTSDTNGNQTVDPDEVVTLLFYPSAPRWVEGGRFTAAFAEAYENLVAWAGEPPLPASLGTAERERRKLVLRDLDQARATLVRNDFHAAPAADRVLVGQMLKIAALVDSLYSRQIGTAALAARVPADDAASQSLFRRNWGPQCVAPGTEGQPSCSAIPGAPRVLYDGYPAALQASPGFCAELEQRPDAQSLADPFGVVRERDGRLVTQSVTEAYRDETASIARELKAAAAGLTDPQEASLRAYLEAAARGFETNQWTEADEAWARMNAQSSRWYVRVAPDEVYRDPCRLKGGFHLTFARINTDSLAWQRKLTPLQQEMEREVAARAGAPYSERRVTFHLPDFIDIVVNAGDDRNPFGATIGQSLPNWGPVANEGRGRTVAMSNLYTDPDSLNTRHAGAASLLDTGSLATVSDDRAAGLLNTILHEAMHNLGPAHEYRVPEPLGPGTRTRAQDNRVPGKTDREIFGGALSATIEELKAQTGALWLVEFLRQRGVVDETFARQVYTDALVWAFGHIANGMYDGNDQRRPKPYSQLAAIQLGFLVDEGAIVWDPQAKAANGTDAGAFVFRLERFPEAIEKMMRHVAGIKARGDKAAAEALVTRYVTGGQERQAVIAERLRRHPKVNFVYAVEL